MVHIELILIHPFREGNSSLSPVLMNVMALQAGWPELDFTVWDEHKVGCFVAIQAGLDDYEPMKHLVRQVLRESRLALALSAQECRYIERLKFVFQLCPELRHQAGHGRAKPEAGSPR